MVNYLYIFYMIYSLRPTKRVLFANNIKFKGILNLGKLAKFRNNDLI